MSKTVTINIDLKRYEELVKKEAMYDALMVDKGVNMYLYQKLDTEGGLRADDK